MIPSIAFAVLAAMTADAAVIPGSLEARLITIGPSVMAVGTNYNGWTSLGCWQDTFNSGSQILNTYQYQPLMTFNSCSSFCTKGGFKYMGLSNGQWCYCDNQINTYNGAGYATSSDKCTLGCAGELTFNCGAFWTNTMFQTTTSYQADQAAKASSVAAYSASSAAAYSASSLAAYSASAGAQYSASSLAAYSRSTSAAAYSQSSLAAYSQAAAASAAAASVAAYSASSLAAYSQGVAASAAAASAAAYSQSSLAAYSQSAAAAYSQSSLAAYSQGVAASAAAASAAASSAAAYSRSTSAAAYSASSLAAYSQGVAASAAAASAAAYSQSSLAAYSQAAAASAAAASVAAYSASVAAYSQGVAASAAAASASAYSASSAAAASAVAASAAAYSAGIASASAYSASAAAFSASSSAAAAAATTIPSPWVAASASCIAEGTTGRALTGDSTSGSDMTYSKCLNYCSGKGYSIAGLEYSRECYCGNSLLNGASLTNTSPNCNMACAGSSSTTCGGPGALTVFVVPSKITGLNADLTVKTAALPTGWSVASTSCVAEGTTGRALTGASTAAADMTGAKCASFCADKGFRFAGTEYGQECYCGNDLTNGASLTKPSQSCNMACAGDANSICGGPGALNLYTNPNVTPVTTSSGSGGNGGFTGPVSNNIPSGWSAAPSACIQEVSGRALTGASTANDKMTIGTCLTFCQSKGFQYAGLEYGSECYCGNELTNGAALSKTANQCTMACSGDATSTCGGPNSIQLFQNPSLAPVTPKASVVGGYTAAGCIQEVSGRALTGLRVDYADMTQEKCVAACSAAGFKMAGIEYGQECYCGNSLVNGASTTLTSGQCVMDCPGNSSQKCGGPNAITLFTA